MDETAVVERFGGMYRAFQYGAPPHGGMAAGVEFRRETQSDDRDENLDGTYTFTDVVTAANLSECFGVALRIERRTNGRLSAYAA